MNLTIQPDGFGALVVKLVVDHDRARAAYERLVAGRHREHDVAPDHSWGYAYDDDVAVTFDRNGESFLSANLFLEHEDDDALDGTLPPAVELGLQARLDLAAAFRRLLN